MSKGVFHLFGADSLLSQLDPPALHDSRGFVVAGRAKNLQLESQRYSALSIEGSFKDAIDVRDNKLDARNRNIIPKKQFLVLTPEGNSMCVCCVCEVQQRGATALLSLELCVGG
jgi:hypothetical protein